MNNIIGNVTEIGDLEQIRRTTKPDIFKRLITIETPDGQKLFGELSNNNIKLLEREGIEEGKTVEVDFLFRGTEKEGKKYNNIFINNIKVIQP